MSELDAVRQDIENIKTGTMKYEGEQYGLKVEIGTFMGGLAWLFTNKKGDTLSVICHTGSYGRKNGLFEIMPGINEEDVTGYLTFGEVQEQINLLRLKGEEDENGCVL